MSHTYIACDLGAESGRVILGKLENGCLTLEELHRFDTGARRLNGSLRWNVMQIFEELKLGLRKAAQHAKAAGLTVESLSTDSWGVDYALFGQGSPLLAPPHHYRDSRTDATYPRAIEKATPELIFSETGIQFMSINTLYQLIAEMEQSPGLVAAAEQFLNIADYLNFLFSGEARAEESLASTTQLYNPRTRSWSKELITLFNLPEAIFPRLIPSATRLATILPDIASETGLPATTEVIAACSHDTGCAVAAVPAEGEEWAYLSSGTWSLLGVELASPLINEAVQAANYTNEAGICGTTRFLKNTAGLWILQECRRAWAAEGQALDYAELAELANDAEPLRSLVDPTDDRFLKPGDMPEKVRAFCRETGQPEPGTPGEFTRTIYDSLALLYKQNIEGLQVLTGRTIRQLHIVGGGSKSRLLNQLAANATRCEVLAGPVEATAIGSLLGQALALGHIGSLAALRQTVRHSFPVETFHPEQGAATALWAAASARFASLTAAK